MDIKKKFKTNKNLALIIICILILIVLVIYIQISKNKKKTNPYKSLPRYKSAITEIVRTHLPEKKERVICTRDPFLFGNIASNNAKTSELKLKGFIEENGKYSAFINNDIVEKGDVILGWKIIRITSEKVILKKNNKRKIITKAR
jgi:hypothetical protein